MRTFYKLALAAWAAMSAASGAIGSGLLSWETLEAGELCLFKLFLGITCPGCGMGHALLHAFQGHWAESFSHHPLGLPFLAVWTSWVVWGGLNLRAGRSFSEGFPVSSALKRPVPALLAVAVVFGVYVL